MDGVAAAERDRLPIHGFTGTPARFANVFDANPALDVPAPSHQGNGHCHA